VDAGSREENASKQEFGASVLIQAEPIMLGGRFLSAKRAIDPGSRSSTRTWLIYG
jgi:hypothetical protein